MKKRLSLLLALVMVLTLVPFSAFAAVNSPNKWQTQEAEKYAKSFFVTYDVKDSEVADSQGWIKLVLEQPSSVFREIKSITLFGSNGTVFVPVSTLANPTALDVSYLNNGSTAVLSFDKDMLPGVFTNSDALRSLKDVTKVYIAGTYSDAVTRTSKYVTVSSSIWKNAVSQQLDLYLQYNPTVENYAWMVTPKLEIGRGVREYTSTFAIYFDGKHDYAVRVVGADFVSLNSEDALYKPMEGPFSDNDKNDQVVYLEGENVIGTKYFTATLRTYRDTYYGDIYVDVTRGQIKYDGKPQMKGMDVELPYLLPVGYADGLYATKNPGVVEHGIPSFNGMRLDADLNPGVMTPKFGSDKDLNLRMAYLTSSSAVVTSGAAAAVKPLVYVDYLFQGKTGLNFSAFYSPKATLETVADVLNVKKLYNGAAALTLGPATVLPELTGVLGNPELQALAAAYQAELNKLPVNAVAAYEAALLAYAQAELEYIHSAVNLYDRDLAAARLALAKAALDKAEADLKAPASLLAAEKALVAGFNRVLSLVKVYEYYMVPDTDKLVFSSFSKLQDGMNIRLVVADYVPLGYTLVLDDPIKTVVADGFTKYIVNVTLKAHGGYLPSIVDWTVDGGKVVVPSRFTNHVWYAENLPEDFRAGSDKYSAEAYDVFGKYAGTLQNKFSSLLDWDQRSSLDPQFYWVDRKTNKYLDEWWGEQRAVELKKEMKMQLLVQPNMAAEEVTLNAKGIGVGAGASQVLDLTIPVLKLNPILKMETSLTKAPAGQKLIKTADITLTEVVPGAIKAGYTYKLTLDNKYSAIFNDKDIKVEVVYADGEQKQLQISDDDVTGNVISFFVQKQSINKPGVIKITGVAVDAAREVPFGTYKLQLSMQDPRITVKTKVAEVDYLEITNVPLGEKPAAGVKVTVFTIGQKFYTENGEVKYMDVAPWIQNSRAMLPIAFVANALSVQYVWDPVARTATFMDGTRTVVLKAGSDQMTVNGAAETMDGPAVIQNSRMFVSVAYVAKAFGLESGKDIVWDATAKTVTITK